MAVNLTPQYHAADEEFKRAQTSEERLTCLKKMLQLVPKHKASEKLQADLKSKIKDATAEVEQDRKSGKKSGGPSFKVNRQGAGQCVLLGAPNCGKSRLLSRLTSAKPEVAAYPFTTREPIVGMMHWQDVRIQIVDLPPITADFLEPFVSSLTRAADSALLFLDLSDDDGPFATQTVIDRLSEHKTQLIGDHEPASEAAVGVVQVRTLIVAMKSASDGAMDRLQIANEMFGVRFQFLQVELENDSGLPELSEAMFRLLRVIRIYAKEPGKPIDKSPPFTCPIGSTVVDFAGCVHRDLAEKTRNARIWGSGAFDGQTVGREHVLSDGDIVELHA